MKNEQNDFRLIYRFLPSLSNPPSSIRVQNASCGVNLRICIENAAKKHERKSVFLTETGLLFPEKTVFYYE